MTNQTLPLVLEGAHSDEIELLSCACSVRIAPETACRIQAILEKEVDWTWLVDKALEHGVAALLFRGLMEVAADAVPPQISNAAEEFSRSQRSQNQLRAVELLRIIAALKERGIAVMPFKGPMLAQAAYGDIGLRSFGDLDFLIHERDITDCLRVLRDLDYNLDADYDVGPNRYYGQDRFYHRVTGIAIEPHWKLTAPFLALRLDHGEIWARARPARLLDTEVLSPSPEDLVTLLGVHGSQHAWSRLKWACDIAEAIRACNGIDWEAMLSRARERGCLRMILVGLALSHRLHGAELPKDVTTLLARDATAIELSRELQQALFKDGVAERDGRGRHITRFNLRVRERFHQKAGFVAACIFLPRSRHFELVRLPGWLWFCSFPIKVLYDYCAMPLWSLIRPIANFLGRRSVDQRP